MITLFTTTKDFSGINRSNQLNAIRSWLHSPFKPQVLIFGKSPGSEEVGINPHLEFLPQVKTSATGAPYANEMFSIASENAKYPVCCYINADIILSSDFYRDIKLISNSVRKKYLIVGQRTDADVNEEIDYGISGKEISFEKYLNNAKEHPPYGSDFFVFPKGQYNLSDIPDLLIGRPAWDNWMIYNGRKRNFKVIDVSSSIKVIHQNHDYTHNKQRHSNVNLDPETLFNRKKFNKENEAYLFTLSACNFIFQDNKLKKNYARGDRKLYLRIEHALNKEKILYRVKWRIKKVLNNNIEMPYL